jgi:hypothetical protein
MDFSFTEGNCVWIVLSPETHLKTPPLLLKFLRDNEDVREKIRQAATKHRFSTWEAVWVDHEFFQYPFLLEKNTPDNMFVEDINNQFRASSPLDEDEVILHSDEYINLVF